VLTFEDNQLFEKAIHLNTINFTAPSSANVVAIYFNGHNFWGFANCKRDRDNKNRP
jgi:hypothetical protein